MLVVMINVENCKRSKGGGPVEMYDAKERLHIFSLATLAADQVAKPLASRSDVEVEHLRHDWEFLARQDQLPPPGDWRLGCSWRARCGQIG